VTKTAMFQWIPISPSDLREIESVIARTDFARFDLVRSPAGENSGHGIAFRLNGYVRDHSGSIEFGIGIDGDVDPSGSHVGEPDRATRSNGDDKLRTERTDAGRPRASHGWSVVVPSPTRSGFPPVRP
jgi:hypothetical protein